MAHTKASTYPVLSAKLQVAFYAKLKTLRDLYFDRALGQAVEQVGVSLVNRQLEELVEKASLGRVASFNLRGEVVFPVPCLLELRPRLLGYYRLRYGLSQKEFYTKGPFGAFKHLEDVGAIPDRLRASIPAVCKSLIETAQELAAGLDELTLAIVDDLQLLTLGPQLRGSRNTVLGQDATKDVFDLIKTLLEHYIKKEIGTRSFDLMNASKRTVSVRFGTDPDVRVSEKLKTGDRPLLAMEIKGGTDYSNVHNRLGEAEKSHLKARQRGFNECWTILGVDLDEAIARRSSPTTTRCFCLDKIKLQDTHEHRRFRDQLASLLRVRL